MHFCIVGTGRCGSTFLKNILNLHPDVFVFNETHWIPKMYEIFGTGKGKPEEFAHILLNSFHISDELVTPIEIRQILSCFKDREYVTVSEFCDAIGSMFANNEGKYLWADKTPDYGPWIGVVQRLWPNCKIIHMIRHGADTAVSMSRHPGYQWLVSAREDYWVSVAYNRYFHSLPMIECSLEEFGALWRRRLQRIRDEARLLKEGSYREFRLESFATEPKRTIKSIARFIGLQVTDEWIRRSMEILDINRICKARTSLEFLGRRELKLLHELDYQ